MADLIDQGGYAFPMPSGAEPRVNETTHYNEDMTLRDWFAGMALQGQCACPVTAESWDQKVMAEQAYHQADAMLKARKVIPRAT